MKIRRLYGLATGLICALTVTGRAATPTLTQADVNTVIAQGVAAATKYKDHCVIAVSDREGYILGVYDDSAGKGNALTQVNAIDKAGTAAYLSSNGEAFTSRTAAARAGR